MWFCDCKYGGVSCIDKVFKIFQNAKVGRMSCTYNVHDWGTAFAESCGGVGGPGQGGMRAASRTGNEF